MGLPIGKHLLIGLPIVAIAVLGLHGWWSTRHVETTDDAYVKADIVIVSAQIAGYVATVDVMDHQPVAAGMQLLRIESGDFELVVDRARALVEARRAAIARIEREMRLQEAMIEVGSAQAHRAGAEERRARLDAQRFEKLALEHIVSRQLQERAAADADQAYAQLTSAKATREAEARRLEALKSARSEARALLSEAEAALGLAQLDLMRTIVRAPAAGVVGNRAIQAGQYIRPGTQLLAIVPISKSYVIANFKETQLRNMRAGQRAELHVDAYPNIRLRGVVQSLAPASGAEFALLPPENATGNFRKIVQRVPVRIALDEFSQSAGVLRPGLSVIVSIETARDAHAAAPASGAAFGQP
jgi:membrane fusion protein (multidrug efflux system)